MKTDEVLRRKREFPDPILEVGRESPLIDRVISRYAHGGFATIQDALVEMIVILNAQGRDYQAQLLKVVQTAQPGIIKPQA